MSLADTLAPYVLTAALRRQMAEERGDTDNYIDIIIDLDDDVYAIYSDLADRFNTDLDIVITAAIMARLEES